MASRIIGVLGRKRHGKDTFATRLTAEHGFTRLAFADALRYTAFVLDPWISVEQDERYLVPFTNAPRGFIRLSALVRDLGWEQAKSLREVRRTLQHMGVGVRDLDPEFWVRIVMEQAAEIPGPVVITDVRFPNEFDAVSNHSRGVTVRVVNPRLPQPDVEHISETALDHAVPRFTVPNAGTIEDLHKHADRIAALS